MSVQCWGQFKITLNPRHCTASTRSPALFWVIRSRLRQMADLRVLAGSGLEEERCWGMKGNTIPAVLGGAPEPNPASLTPGTSSDSWLSLCFFLLFWGLFKMFWSSAIQCHLWCPAGSGSVFRFGVLEPGPAPEVALLRHGDLSPHPYPILILLNQTLMGNPGMRVFGKLLDGFNEVLSRSVPNLSVRFDFSLCRISHHCKGAETRNCFNTKLFFF